MKVMIVVTHLLGTGHLARAMTLARAFEQEGHDTMIVSGGRPAPHLKDDALNIAQLPPVQSDGIDFSRLLDAEGQETGPRTLAMRSSLLVGHLSGFAPDALITELFPFGRRILRDEFLDLLKAAAGLPNRPIVCASIRDILAPPSKPKKAVFADEVIEEFYHAVLVHSDPSLMPLDLSWPVSDHLSPYLRYTGFVAPPAAAPQHKNGLGKDEILVSAGGGDVGMHLFHCAVDAARLSSSIRWRLLIGGADAREHCTRIMATAPSNLIAEPARPEFRAMLYRARASVSFCGYNTALDVLQAQCPAVFVPFDAGNEVEQGIRATALAARPGIAQIATEQMSAASLLAMVVQVTNDPPRPSRPFELDGAAETVSIVENLWGDRT